MSSEPAAFRRIDPARHTVTLAPASRRALSLAKKHRATLVIAKLDRLSRSMAFTATLMDAGVDFVAVDNPNASRLTPHTSRCSKAVGGRSLRSLAIGPESPNKALEITALVYA